MDNPGKLTAQVEKKQEHNTTHCVLDTTMRKQT